LNNKYLIYSDEIADLWHLGHGYAEISRILIDRHHLNVKSDYLRKSIAAIIKYHLADKEIIDYNVRLAKQKQKAQDLNRIANKSFREHARIENALATYNEELIKLLKKNQLSINIPKNTNNENAAMIVQIADTHFNELVDLQHNKYDFIIASKRLQKFAHYIKQYAEFHKVNNILIAITGDLINSDRRLDEKLAMATNRAKATFLGVHLLKQFIVDLSTVADISVACVTGNESRVNEELGWVDIVASDNYDFTIFEMLRLLLPDITFIRGDALELVVEVAGQNVLLIHGHQLGKMDSNRISKVVAKYSRKAIKIDFIICGHLHETMITDLFARSSSLVGANAYSENALNLSSRAAQNIYIMLKEGRQDIRIDLQDVKGYKGYMINKELTAYNAKSFEKIKPKNTIFKIII
jgi:predicted MPP superfamily phosphohydrolase